MPGMCTRRDRDLEARYRSQDQDVQSRGQGKSEAFEISTKARPSRGTTVPRDGLKTQASKPRPHPWKSRIKRALANPSLTGKWSLKWCVGVSEEGMGKGGGKGRSGTGGSSPKILRALPH